MVATEEIKTPLQQKLDDFAEQLSKVIITFFSAPHNEEVLTMGHRLVFVTFVGTLKVASEFEFISNLCVSPAAQNTCLGCGPSTSVSHSPQHPLQICQFRNYLPNMQT